MRIIDAESLREEFNPVKWPECDFSPEAVQKMIDEEPTADVARHGVWVPVPSPLPLYECSCCGQKVMENRFKYCSTCGAKMDEVTE